MQLAVQHTLSQSVSLVKQSMNSRAVFVRFSLGASEFRLSTSDYSGHVYTIGCQIGTVE